jgi:excisionase family DNA binding protein
VKSSPSDDLDVRAAARLAGRTTETIRRWVWSGRLSARKRGSRLLVSRSDVEALAGPRKGSLSLREWATLAEAAMRSRRRKGASAADLVTEERIRRLDGVAGHRGR